MSVVVEYHEHQPVTAHIGDKPVWGCGYIRIDGTPCPDFIAGRGGIPVRWSVCYTTSREAIDAHIGGQIVQKIESYRDANDFARPPDWWQAIDAILDLAKPAKTGATP